MKALTLTLLSTLIATVAVTTAAEARRNGERFHHRGDIANEDTGTGQDTGGRRPSTRRFSEAPTGFDNQTNGYLRQGPDYESLDEDNVVPLRSFNDNRFIFEEVEGIDEGLGPVYNAQSCRECHQNVVTGGASQIAEHRTGKVSGDEFFESLGGSLVQSRAIHPDIVELVLFEDDIRTFRISSNTLGAGYVEAIANQTLLQIRDSQPESMRGNAIMTVVLEADGATRIGRFGWKSQHASLLSFSADAYLNEMGITSPLFPEENTSSGLEVGFGSGYDEVPDPEDDGTDVLAFADFMRATKAPARGPLTAGVPAGEQLFKDIGCVICHVDRIVTSAPGTPINGGKFRVPDALGNRIIHPYSDFLMHDIGTGDGIPVLNEPEFAATAPQIRTAPLWGLRTRNRLMHDGLSFTTHEAITRHGHQAAEVTAAYSALSANDQELLLEFLDSL